MTPRTSTSPDPDAMLAACRRAPSDEEREMAEHDDKTPSGVRRVPEDGIARLRALGAPDELLAAARRAT